MVCIDTTFLIDLIRKNQTALKKLSELEKRSADISTTIINAAELYRGAHGSAKKVEELAEVNRILDLFNILNLDRHSTERFGQIASDVSIKSQSPGDLDLLIASIALTHNETTILTRNTRHFERVPGLTVENW